MPLSEIGKPFQGIVYYAVEDDFASTITDAEAWLPISKYVQSVRVGTGDKHESIRGFDSPLVKDLIMKTNEPEIHIEYHPQCDDTLMMDAVNRGSCCTLKSFTFVVGVSTCFTGDPDNNSYFLLKGCKAATVRIASAHDEPYTVTIDFLAKSIEPLSGSEAESTEDGDLLELVPAELEGGLLQFNVAGSISKQGGDYVISKNGENRLAYITNSIDITIENQLTTYSDHDSLDRDYIIEGTVDVSGTVDITLDGGGASHMKEVLSQNDFSVIIDMGNPGCPRIVLHGCQWDAGEVTGDVGGEAVMASCLFTAKPVGCSEDVPGLDIIKSSPSEEDE